MDRRTLLKQMAALGVWAVPFPALLIPAPARAEQPDGAFSYAWLKGHARHLASEPHASREGKLPASLQDLGWDDYQAIQFRPEASLWRNRDSLFQARFFHLGLYFQTPVHMYRVTDGRVQPLAYEPDYFRYGDRPDPDTLPEDLGYAGFRLQFHTDFERDVVAFLGASYFRAVGEQMQYGLSARGLAIDTALDREEEFPDFTAFWLETPAPGSDTVVVHALLDSPSVTGAYRFVITPGVDLVMLVDAALYPRTAIERLGIAPLTSMYQMGENDRRVADDWRPEIHDSDGLSLLTGAGQWIWRPLMNPATLQYNAYQDENPGGFGLLQRDRNFDHYQDDGVFYDRRPGLWVEPGENWGKGAVALVEIPTQDETFDNIVAFWNPEKPLEPGREALFSYRLTWGARPPVHPENLARVVATRTGAGGVVGQPREYFSRRFAIDFSGGQLAMLAEDSKVEPVISTSQGRVEITSARPLDAVDGYRALFDLVPETDSTDPIDLQLHLQLGDQVLTETWSYQYTPPPADERTW